MRRIRTISYAVIDNMVRDKSIMTRLVREIALPELGFMVRMGVVFGAAHNVYDLINDEQARVSGALVEVADGSMLTVSSPFWISGEDKVPAGPAPAIGEHTDAVLGDAGYGAEEITKLRGAGVVG